MQESSDLQLLRRYAENGDEEAFRELVARHTDLVYSAALRQTSDHHLARDLSQNVFTELARKAGDIVNRFKSDSSLLGWLYSAVRFEALNHHRSDRRRKAREIEHMTESPADSDSFAWDQISATLDAALADLAEPHREALLLRFFKNLDFRAIGQTFGISDDAAQKRVTRALERLRENFARRGVSGTAAALAAALSANAVSAAPAGMAVSLASAALSLSPTPVVSAAIAKTFVMTTAQKYLVASAFVLAIGTGLYEAGQSSKLRDEVTRLKQQVAASPAPTVQTNSDFREDAGKVAALQAENAQLRRDAAEVPRLRGELASVRRDLKELADSAAAKSDPFIQQALKWKANEARLRQLFEDRPDQRIPELRLVGEGAWFDLAKGADFETDTGARKAMADMRRYAGNIFVNSLSEALGKFVAKNDSRLPNSPRELLPFFDKPIDPDLLDSYRMAHTGFARDVPRGDWAMTNALIDADYDTRWGIGPGGFGILPESPERVSGLVTELESAFRAYAASNNGAAPNDVSQLKPFLKTPEQEKAFQQLQALRASKRN